LAIKEALRRAGFSRILMPKIQNLKQLMNDKYLNIHYTAESMLKRVVYRWKQKKVLSDLMKKL
jgi:hypothetical protein